MGQYYRTVLLSDEGKPIAKGVCYDFGSGAKLMEHSWMKNEFVGFIESVLSSVPHKIVWAGDYADEDFKISEDQVKMLFKKHKEYYESEEEQESLLLSLREGINLYSYADEFCPKLTHDQDVKRKYSHEFGYANQVKYKYLINYDKKEFVDKSKVPGNDGWHIHPLPLLTCEGNGRGGGDFRGNGRDLIGRWSRDKIGVVSRKSDIPKGFNEVLFNLIK